MRCLDLFVDIMDTKYMDSILVLQQVFTVTIITNVECTSYHLCVVLEYFNTLAVHEDMYTTDISCSMKQFHTTAHQLH